jgi:hypothetical protein
VIQQSGEGLCVFILFLNTFFFLKARLRRTKIASSPSYADYRPKTNAVILLDMGHTLRGECAREE